MWGVVANHHLDDMVEIFLSTWNPFNDFVGFCSLYIIIHALVSGAPSPKTTLTSSLPSVPLPFLSLVPFYLPTFLADLESALLSSSNLLLSLFSAITLLPVMGNSTIRIEKGKRIDKEGIWNWNGHWIDGEWFIINWNDDYNFPGHQTSPVWRRERISEIPWEIIVVS